MFCPSCQNTLRERERNGVMLDICPGCGGVWLDRGELEKLTMSERSYYRRGDDNDDEDDDDHWQRGQRYDTRPDDRRRNYGEPQRYETQTRQRRGGFLENIFGNFGGGNDDD
jgi:Zn-finger nucleic acid-binding protein